MSTYPYTHGPFTRPPPLPPPTTTTADTETHKGHFHKTNTVKYYLNEPVAEINSTLMVSIH